MVSKNPNYELETEDTLSLCDLSIYTDSTSDTGESLNSSFSSSDEDFFDFFTEKRTPSYHPETFLFCGKLITPPNQGLMRRDSVNSNLNDCKRRKDVSNSPSWSRWQLFVFGLAKLPAEVEVGDSPRPPGRRISPAVFKSGGEKDEGCKRRKGLWGLVRDLSCSRRRRERLPA